MELVNYNNKKSNQLEQYYKVMDDILLDAEYDELFSDISEGITAGTEAMYSKLFKPVEDGNASFYTRESLLKEINQYVKDVVREKSTVALISKN